MNYKTKSYSFFYINLIFISFFITNKAFASMACDNFSKPGIEIKIINDQVNLFSTGESDVLLDDPSFYDFAYANAEENAKIKLLEFISKENPRFCNTFRSKNEDTDNHAVISKTEKFNFCENKSEITSDIRGFKNHNSCYSKGKFVRVTVVASEYLKDISKKMENIIDNNNFDNLLPSENIEYININKFKSF